MGFNIGSQIDSVMARVRKATEQVRTNIAAAAESVKEPLADAPNAKPLDVYQGVYLDSFEPERARQKGLVELAAPPPPGSTAPPSGMPVNEAEQAQQENGWKSTQPTVVQTSKTGCAEAALTFLEQSDSEAPAPLTQQQAQEQVRNKADTLASSPSGVKDQGVHVNLDDGATPAEMGAVLGSMGIAVTRSSADCDTRMLSHALNKGELALAQVDSNALLNTTLDPDKQTQEPGELHWITIDGINPGLTDSADDDLYHVRDSVNGAYWMTAADLKKCVSSAKENHDGGGVMTIQKEKDRKTKTPEQLEALAQRNVERANVLGKGNGGASRRASISESS